MKILVVGIILLLIGIAVLSSIEAENTSYFNCKKYTLRESVFSVGSPIEKWTAKSTTMTVDDFSDNTLKAVYSVQEPSFVSYNGKTLYVGGKGPGNYSFIRSAVYAASDGDTVFVYSGTYHEGERSAIEINKSINLIGENRNTTIIDGQKPNHRIVDVMDAILDIAVNGVTISGFTIENSGTTDYADSGITLRSSYNTISGNILSNNGNGISFIGTPYYFTNNNIIKNNVFTNNAYGMIISGSTHNIIYDNVFNHNGIIVDTYPNTFLNNSINGKPFVYLQGESNKTITEDAGQVILFSCDNITVQHKDLSNATVGILLDHTHHCSIADNTIRSDTWGGIRCVESNHNNLSRNTISDTPVTADGIVIDNSTENVVFSNAFTLNYCGTYLVDFSSNNTILMNTFSDNTVGLSLTYGAYHNNIIDNIFFHDGAFVYGAWYNTFLNNTVNNKPLIYLEGVSDKVIDEDAGQVILVSCDSVTVKNQTILHTYAGISLVASNNCLLTSNILDSNNDCDICVTHSNGDNISLNTVSNSSTGIYVDSSNHTVILWNTITANTNTGILVILSNDTSVLRNTIKGNGDGKYFSGIFLQASNNNKIEYNNFLYNTKGAYFIGSTLNTWNHNYWDKSRLLPKLVRGVKSGIFFVWPTVNVDWHPAQKLYNIPGMT